MSRGIQSQRKKPLFLSFLSEDMAGKKESSLLLSELLHPTNSQKGSTKTNTIGFVYCKCTCIPFLVVIAAKEASSPCPLAMMRII